MEGGRISSMPGLPVGTGWDIKTNQQDTVEARKKTRELKLIQSIPESHMVHQAPLGAAAEDPALLQLWSGGP